MTARVGIAGSAEIGAIEARVSVIGFERTDFSAASDPDEGGHLFYVTPRVLFTISNGWVCAPQRKYP